MLFLFEKKISEVRNVVSILKKTFNDYQLFHSFEISLSPSGFVTIEFKLVSTLAGLSRLLNPISC